MCSYLSVGCYLSVHFQQLHHCDVMASSWRTVLPVSTQLNETMRSQCRAFCFQRGTPMKDKYIYYADVFVYLTANYFVLLPLVLSPPVAALPCFHPGWSLFLVCLRPCVPFSLWHYVCIAVHYPANIPWNAICVGICIFGPVSESFAGGFLGLIIVPSPPCLIAINCFLLNKSLHNLFSLRRWMIQSVKPSVSSAAPRQICHSTSGLSASFLLQLDFPNILGRPHPSGRSIIRACITSFPGIPKVRLPQHLVWIQTMMCNQVVPMQKSSKQANKNVFISTWRFQLSALPHVSDDLFFFHMFFLLSKDNISHTCTESSSMSWLNLCQIRQNWTQLNSHRH